MFKFVRKIPIYKSSRQKAPFCTFRRTGVFNFFRRRKQEHNLLKQRLHFAESQRNEPHVGGIDIELAFTAHS